LHLKPLMASCCGAEVNSPIVVPISGSPITTSHAFGLASPLRVQGVDSNPSFWVTPLPAVIVWPFGRPVYTPLVMVEVCVWRSTTPQP
jgi:hypothetical protein